MDGRDAFSRCHPLVAFAFFALVLLLTMLVMRPAFLAISLLGAAAYGAYLRRRRFWRMWRTLLPLLVLTAAVNPLFSHRGVTVLAYFPSGNPLTLESILYGLAAAALLCCAVLWLGCCSDVMTTDKFVYLFGRLAPALSLLLSMTLRFIPQVRRRHRTISDARNAMGGNGRSGALRRRMAELGILTTWSLEGAVDTADSMRSRGYGLPGRTLFSIYRFRRRDGVLLGAMALCGAYTAWGCRSQALAWSFYPRAQGAPLGAFALSVYGAYGLLCSLPLLVDLAEELRWAAAERRAWNG